MQYIFDVRLEIVNTFNEKVEQKFINERDIS